jgi:hypothetical protein
MSIGDIENGNAILKYRVRELENDMIPPPLFLVLFPPYNP